MTPTPKTLFEPDGGAFVATDLSRGPWDPRHCHGGPVSALLARSVETADPHDHRGEPVSWQIARLSIGLTRPVPVGVRLVLTAHVDRPGRKVSTVTGVLTHDDAEVARVHALRIRRAEVAVPPEANETVDGLETPMRLPASARAEVATWASHVEGQAAFHSHACEHRFVEGSWMTPGPCGVWVRLAAGLVPGEDPSGVQRLAAAADFGNGVSATLPFDRFTFLNPDLTIHLAQEPRGEWIGMRSTSRYGSHGAGFAESALYDVEPTIDGRGEETDVARRIGRSLQSLIVAPR